jgi:hypothetical protein
LIQHLEKMGAHLVLQMPGLRKIKPTKIAFPTWPGDVLAIRTNLYINHQPLSVVNLAPAAAVLVVVCIVFAAFGGYEYSQNRYQMAAAVDGQISQVQSEVAGMSQTVFATTASQTVFGNQSQTGQSITTPLVYAEKFTADPAGNATSTNFPFLSQIVARSWGDTGVVISGTGPSPVRVSQTSYRDCIFRITCDVNLGSPIHAGDIILVFVSGYSPNVGWHASSINDSLGLSFSLYKVSNWPAGPNAYTDSLYYATVPAGVSSDSITVSYNSVAQHSDPIVMDVTGTGLSVFGGATQDCTAFPCSTEITTQPVSLGTNYLAAANAYTDLGIAAAAQTGWTQVSSGAVFAGHTSFMTGEYASSQNAAQSCTYVPILPSNFAAQTSGYLSVTGVISAPSETLVVSQPFVSSTNSTYVLTPSSPSSTVTTTTISGQKTNVTATATVTTTGTSTVTITGSTTRTPIRYVSLNIPVHPGNIVADLENCGPTAISATLSINMVA